MATVKFHIEDGLGILTLSNPPLNLMTWEMIDQFETAVHEVAGSPIRALLIRAEGPHFMAGANVGMFKDVPAAQARATFSRSIPVLNRIEQLPYPTIVATQGFCMAAGLELALAADIIVAGESTRFAQVEVHIGTSTLLGGAERLVQRAGPARARQIVFDGEQFTAQQFASWNIINHVVRDDEVQQFALSLARRYASGPTQAYAVGKTLIRAATEAAISNADRVLIDTAPRLFETEDMQRGVNALLEHGSRAVIGKVQFLGR